jgi:hypothetical protein
MKGIVAAFTALAVLWIADVSFNGGRFTMVVVRVLRPVLTAIGIQ